ncbi:MAG: glycosyltransferase family 4 protein [Candidatus Latescibacterota bacterium]
MNVLQIHNWYRIKNGEDIVVENTVRLLETNGERVIRFHRDSGMMSRLAGAGMRAFANSIYSPSAVESFRRLLDRERPDVAEIHNVFPFISPAILSECATRDTPVVMRCHNFRLLCPAGDLFRDGKICERCASGKEYWCALLNCRKRIPESIACALRSAASRFKRYFLDNVSTFIALTRFAKTKLSQSGIPVQRIAVLPNMTPIPPTAADPGKGEYIAFVGNLHPKKGVSTLVSAAAETGLTVRLAGDNSGMKDFLAKAPPNVSAVGWLDRDRTGDFFRNARFVVVPSECFEMCPMVILEAMGHGVPVIASRIGGLPELVDDGETGFLFETGNAGDLAEKLRILWEDRELCRRLGANARDKAVRKFSAEAHYRRLMEIYRQAARIQQR